MPEAARVQQHIQHMLTRQAFIGITKIMYSTITELRHARKRFDEKMLLHPIF
jgi:hypothetical protein